MPPELGALFAGLHHMQLAMPRGEEDAARGFFAGVLGMSEIYAHDPFGNRL